MKMRNINSDKKTTPRFAKVKDLVYKIKFSGNNILL